MNAFESFIDMFHSFNFFEQALTVITAIVLIIFYVGSIRYFLSFLVHKGRYGIAVYGEKACKALSLWTDDFYDNYYHKPTWADRDLYDQTCISHNHKNY